MPLASEKIRLLLGFGVDLAARTAPSAQHVPAGRRTRNFVLGTYAFTWIPMLTMIGFGADVHTGPAQLIFAVAACGPSLVAAIMWLAHPRDRRPSRIPVWWVIPLGLVVGAAIPALPAVVLHSSQLSQSSSAAVADGGGLLGFLGLTLMAGPLAEEFGWRGYLQPRVRNRHGVATTTAIIGSVWAIWHLPLFFLHGTGQHAAGLLSVRGVTLLAGLIPFSLVMLLLVERLRGGVFAALAAHFGFNAGDSLVPNPGTMGMLLELAVLLLIAFGAAAVYRRDASASRRTRTRRSSTNVDRAAP